MFVFQIVLRYSYIFHILASSYAEKSPLFFPYATTVFLLPNGPAVVLYFPILFYCTTCDTIMRQEIKGRIGMHGGTGAAGIVVYGTFNMYGRTVENNPSNMLR